MHLNLQNVAEFKSDKISMFWLTLILYGKVRVCMVITKFVYGCRREADSAQCSNIRTLL